MTPSGRALEAIPGPARLVSALIVLILVQLVVAQAINMFPRLIPIDFYQYWGVAAARRLSGSELGSPYRNYREYHAVLNAYAEHSDQPRLVAVARAMPAPGFTATPFLYMLFAALPIHYTGATILFQVLQVLLLLGGVGLLGFVYRHHPVTVVCLALLLVLGSGPVSADFRVGNLGCFQFAALAALLVVADRRPRREPASVLAASALLGGATLLVVAKPNVVPVLVVLAIHVWVVYGTRIFAVAVLVAALCGGAAIVMGSLYFGSSGVWYDWYRVVYGSNPRTLARVPAGGNYATSLLIARWLNVDVWSIAVAIAGVLTVSLPAVLAASTPRAGGVRAMLRRALARLFGDPHLAMAIGVTAAIALPPLVWYHYQVMALIPGLWLLSATSQSRSAALCGLLAVALSVGVLNVLFLPLGWIAAATAAASLSWLPLWVGILIRLAAPAQAGPEVAEPAQDTSGDRRAAESRRARRPATSKALSRG